MSLVGLMAILAAVLLASSVIAGGDVPILFQDTLDVDGAGGVDYDSFWPCCTIPVAGDVKYHPFRSASSFRQRSLICPTKNVDLVHCDQCRFNKHGAHAPLSSG
ncbi:hypothetical protein PVAP13_6KG374706 [Panicum virgatum]|uniref:Uncharacterized protein n=1 Tax=Panicum virgatum TaxID=38727 RepID=A0A8T0RIC6_PANVG|nr:hypothetical protein PVAP13_6KG374706 [Panicum virgatum]